MKAESSTQNRAASQPVKQAISRLIKAEMAKRGLKYRDIVEGLQQWNIDLTEANLRGKVNKGLIPADLMLIILQVIGVKTLVMEEVFALMESDD